jgi:hypothetical protein
MTREKYMSSSYLTLLRPDYSLHNIGHKHLTMVDKPTASHTMTLSPFNGTMGDIRKL